MLFSVILKLRIRASGISVANFVLGSNNREGGESGSVIVPGVDYFVHPGKSIK